MNTDRRKIKRRRWAIFVAVVLCLIVSIGGFYGFRKLQHNWRIDGYKEEARTSMDEGDPVNAYHKYRGYLSRHPDDLDALRGLAEAIREIDPNQTQDPRELIYLYQQILKLSPDEVDSRIALMELYHRVNFPNEAIELASEILEGDTGHARAYEIRAIQHARLRQFELAIADSRQYLQYDPTNIDNRILLIRLLAQSNAPEAEVLAWGGDLTKVIEWDQAPPDYDPHSFVSELVNGFAHQMVGETQDAIGYYEQLANQDIEDPQLARLLVNLLEGVGRLDDAMTLLQRVTNELGLVDLRTDLCRRLWESHAPKAVLSQFGSDYSQALEEPGAYPFVVYSLYATGERVAADSLVSRGRLSKYLYIETWASLFEILRDAAVTDTEPKVVLAQIREATQRFTNDAHLSAEYAKVLMASGYTEAALTRWQEVATQAPRWSEPMLSIANIMLSTRRQAMAIEPAQAAVRLAPNRARSIETYLRAMVANLERLSADDFNRVRTLLDDVQEEAKIESLIPLQIELIARAEVDDAKVRAREQLQSVVTQDVEYSLGTWLSLISASERHELGLTALLIQQAYEQYGNSPQLAIARVISRDDTNWQAALAKFEQLRLASDEADKLPWQLAKAQLELAIQPDQAGAIWQRLLDQFPKDQLVHVQILQDERNWREDEIDLVRQVLSGNVPKAGTNEIPAIRISRARLKVLDAESEEELAEAVRYTLETSKAYPYLYAPYALLGLCYEKQGRSTLAIEAYTSAHRINPTSDAMLNSRVRLHRELGETEQAQALISKYLEQLANSMSAQPAFLARAYTQQGELIKATDWAQRAVQLNASDRATSLLLASLYSDTGQEGEAESLYNKMMESPDLRTVISTACFYFRTGRPDDGATLITGLEELNIEPSIKAILRGQIDADAGDREEVDYDTNK